MMDDDLSPELRSLFDAERGRDDVPPGAKDRVHAALAASLGAGLGTGAVATKGALVAKGSGAAAAKIAATTAASGGAVTAGATATGGVVAKGLAFALVAAMAGTAGTGIYLAQKDDKPALTTTVPVPVPTQRPFDASVLAPKPVEIPLAPIAHTPVARPKPVEHEAVVEHIAAPVEETPEERATRLAGERTVLDEARAAIARGDGGAALIALEAHRSSYPHGAMVEEREALTVLALAKLGRVDETKAKAQRFKEQFPSSLFMGAVDDAVH